MDDVTQKVICIGSVGKDIFFPVSSGIVLNVGDKASEKKQFCFEYGGKVHVEDRFTALGGCACNVSIGLARLGIDVAAFGNVGNDTDGKWITDVLMEEGVDTKSIQVVDGVNTDLSIVIVNANAGERTIFVNRDVGEKLKLVQSDVSEFDWCFMGSLYGDDIQVNMKTIHNELAKQKIKLAYNPGGKNIKDDENIVLDLIYHAHLVFVNKSEAQEIVSKFNLSYNDKELLDEILLLSIVKEHMKVDDGIVVLTNGTEGAWAYDGKEVYHTKTIDKAVHDATGAGDAFASGFFAGVLHRQTVERCIQWGSVNGDSVIDHYGAQKGLQTIDTIEGKINLFSVENKKKKNEDI